MIADTDDSSGSYSRVRSDASGSLHLEADVGNNTGSSTMRFNMDGSEKMRMDSDGFIGVGTTSIQAHLHVDSEDTGSIFGRAALAVTTADPTVNSSNQLVVLAFTGDNDTTNEGTAGTFISFRDSGGQIGTIDGASSTSVVYGLSLIHI